MVPDSTSAYLIILEKQVREHSDEVIIMTDDGSYGDQGLVTDGVEKVLATGHPVTHCGSGQSRQRAASMTA